MHEHYANFEAFRVDDAGTALSAEPRTTRDVVHGEGKALTVQDTEVEVYPASGAARITLPDARIELLRVPRYAVGSDRIVFFQGEQTDDTGLYVNRDGTVLFTPLQKPPGSSQAGVLPAGGPEHPSQPFVVAEGLTTPRTHQVGESQEKEVLQVQLRGRLGRDPWYSDQGDQPIGGFPLAVNDERSGTTWHRVVVFDTTAEALHEAHVKGQIRKGRLVDVVGSQVIREETRPGGGVRKIPEFHATSFTKVTSTPRRS